MTTYNGNGKHSPVARLTTLQDVKPEHVTWPWPGRLARGKVVVIEGPPGLGKSTLTVTITAHFSVGRALPGGTTTVPADCIILSYEDGIADTIAPRLLAANGDPRRVHVLEGVTVGKDPDSW
jgi:RecA-family ATPase